MRRPDAVQIFTVFMKYAYLFRLCVFWGVNFQLNFFEDRIAEENVRKTQVYS
jgi:hypothetical protein